MIESITYNTLAPSIFVTFQDGSTNDYLDRESFLSAFPDREADCYVFSYVHPPLAQAEIIAQYEKALDDHLDSVAKLHRYDSRFTFALRAGFPGPYHDEAVAFATWMDVCNVQAFALLAEVIAGNAAMPTIEAFIASLPEFAL